ncbi:N-acetylmuramoyl-L-alanine amidase [Clostridium sp. AM34-9AC]|nr:N-acetylmuramoyl-L-alanine amidase [Clostridium sp. AM34-9AC]RHU62633.1 N-acetylmuramoyl-L-alanine amidase [Clostridium sp. TF08-15]
MPLIVLDAGHGGANPGATYNGRKESEDVLALTLAVGSILEENGVDVYYTRTTDVYESPYQKAQEGNEVGGDYFVSIHRNSSPYPNQYSGVESLVYNRYGAAARMAYNINARLEQAGFVNLGVNERPNLVVLNSTNMPAVLVEVGFINTDADNELFDSRFDEIARAIADGILESVQPTLHS